MTPNELKGNWNIIKGKLKQRYAILTDSDLAFVEGGENELFRHLQQKLGKSKEEILNSVGNVKWTTF